MCVRVNGIYSTGHSAQGAERKRGEGRDERCLGLRAQKEAKTEERRERKGCAGRKVQH
jgi:hypothetical protein